MHNEPAKRGASCSRFSQTLAISPRRFELRYKRLISPSALSPGGVLVFPHIKFFTRGVQEFRSQSAVRNRLQYCRLLSVHRIRPYPRTAVKLPKASCPRIKDELNVESISSAGRGAARDRIAIEGAGSRDRRATLPRPLAPRTIGR